MRKNTKTAKHDATHTEPFDFLATDVYTRPIAALATLGRLGQREAECAARYEAEVWMISNITGMSVDEFKSKFEEWIKTQVIGTFDGLRYCSERACAGQTFPWEWAE